MRPRHQGSGQREVGIRLAEQQSGVAGDVDELQSGHEQGIALAAGDAAAVEDLAALKVQEGLLFCRWLVGDPRARQRSPDRGQFLVVAIRRETQR